MLRWVAEPPAEAGAECLRSGPSPVLPRPALKKCMDHRKFALYLSKDGSLVTDCDKAYQLQAAGSKCGHLLPNHTTSAEEGLYPTLGHTKDAHVYILTFEDRDGNVHPALYTA